MDHRTTEIASAPIGHPAAEDASPKSGPIAQFFAMLQKMGVFAQAERDNRRFNRVRKQADKNALYRESGLNGERAMARRQRQIANGSLRRENGLEIT